MKFVNKKRRNRGLGKLLILSMVAGTLIRVASIQPDSIAFASENIITKICDNGPKIVVSTVIPMDTKSINSSIEEEIDVQICLEEEIKEVMKVMGFNVEIGKYHCTAEKDNYRFIIRYGKKIEIYYRQFSIINSIYFGQKAYQ